MKILLNFRAFPIAMGRWFEFALKDLGHEVIVAGPSMGDQVPWPGEHHFPKYNFQPDILLPDVERYPLEKVLEKIPGSKPSLVLQAGDTCWLTGPAPAIMVSPRSGSIVRKMKNVIIATDPHCIDYTPRLKDADFFICMQKFYMDQKYADFKNKDWLPYGFYPPVHKPLKSQEILYDVVFCGLPYDKREDYLLKVKNKGLRVYSGLGLLYEEYNQIYNQGIIAFNHSSLQDVPARFWEGLAMGNLVFTNVVPELQTIAEKFGIAPNVHYIPYSSIDDAVAKTEYMLKHPEKAAKIAQAGLQKVQDHTYYRRMEALLWMLR